MMAPRRIRKRPTSQDVADLAGVSVTTVSFVINDKSGGNVRISDETRRRVWEAVEALNYRPSSAARSLRTKRSNLIALMIPYIETPFHPLLAAAVQREAEKENLDVIIYSTRDDLRREQEFLEVLISRGVDGVIIHTHNLLSDDVERLVEADVAVVIHGNSPTHPFADNVMVDEIKAAEEAVSYLIDKGHTRIGTIAGPEVTWDGSLRKRGYLNALQARGVAVDEELIYEVDHFRRRGGAQGMERLLALPDPPTAVFAASDVMAVGALLFATDSGFLVPEDVAVVGFDDTREATVVRPRLTTVHKDVDVLGASAVRMLIERINGEGQLPGRQKVIEHRLVIRESA